MAEIAAELEGRVAALLGAWPGPFGGLPPFEAIDAASLEAAFGVAADAMRADIAGILANHAAPDFANTIEALDSAGVLFNRISGLEGVYASSMAVGDMRAAVQRTKSLKAQLDDEIIQCHDLFARIDAVWENRAKLSPAEVRLTQEVRQRFVDRGASLSDDAKAQLSALNAEIAALQAQFFQNMMAAEDRLATIFDDARQLDGLPTHLCDAAAERAAKEGMPGRWAIANNRPIVWPFLTLVHDREARERVWLQWSERGTSPETGDNRPLAAKLLTLRGRRARLLGFQTHADCVTARRMARTPQIAMDLMMMAWRAVAPATRAHIAALQAIADHEGAEIEVAPWDLLYYGAKLKKATFALDDEAVKAHLDLNNVVGFILEQAAKLHGLTFSEMPDAPRHHPSVRVFAIHRGDEPIGAVFLDLFAREGKGRGSFQHVFRRFQKEGEGALPLSLVCSALPPAVGDAPVLIGWEYANVMFHEFGHALHMLLDRAPYRALGAMGVAWDFIETPALLNERWLYDRAGIRRWLRHHKTGEPMPDEMIDAVEAGLKHDRIFSLTSAYLAPAILDMRLHMMADGRDIDPVQVEAEVLAELCAPAASDYIFRTPHFYHAFAGGYDAAVYAYLWSDVMAAEIGEAFAGAPGGLFDPDVATRYRETLLTRGATIPMDEAYRRFAGADPRPDALFRRFDLAVA
jgi:peptidyl-dipeptidase Dcp